MPCSPLSSTGEYIAKNANLWPPLSGYVKDDYSAAETQTTGQFERSPPGGGCTVARVAAILHSVVQEASRLLAVLANYGDEEIDQAVVKNGAVIKNGGN